MESESKRKDAAPPIYMNYSNQRKQPELESAPKSEHDAESGYSSRTAYSDRLKDFNDESIADQPSAARRNPPGPDSSSSGINRLSNQQEDLSHQGEDFLRQQDAIHKMGINAVGDEQHLKSGTIHSYGSKRIQEKEAAQQEQHQLNSDLQEARENLKSLWESSSFQNTVETTEERNISQSTGGNQQQIQNQSKTSKIRQYFSRHKGGTNTETQEQRSDLQMEEEKHLCQSIDIIEKNQQEQHKKLRYDLNQVGKEMMEVQHRIHQIETTQQQKLFEIRLREMTEELQITRFTLKDKEEELKNLKHRLSEMNEQFQTTRSVLKKKEEELKSFKDRVALEVAPSIKTGNTMSLNSPVSKNRIREMYETLRCDWPKIKEDLKLAGEKSDSVQKLIQKQFISARTDMDEKNEMISHFFDLDKFKQGTESPEVKENLLLAIQNLQLVIYNQKYDNGSQKPLSAHEVTNHEDMMEYLSSECYWLGCLMALNDPPINLDWENHAESMDKWDILPRNITSVSVKK